MTKIRIFFLVIFTSIFTNVFSQQIGNEWVSYNQKYLRFHVTEDGVYKIPYDVLKSAFNNINIDIQNLNPAGFQVFGRGKEIPIYIKTQNNSFLESGDHIEVYCQRNDGWYDEQLYPNPHDHTNPYYSLFNDTASYYITWNPLLNGQRMTVEEGENFDSYNQIPYFYFENIHYLYSNYTLGELSNDLLPKIEYVNGEGWIGPAYTNGQTRTYNLATTNAYSSGTFAEVEIGVGSTSNPAHHMKIQFAGETIDTVFFGQKYFRFQRQVPASALGATNTSFVFSSVDDMQSPSDRQAVAFIKLKYPHNLQLENTETYKLFLPNFGSLPKSVLKFTSNSIATNSGDVAIVYDITNGIRVKPQKSGNQFSALMRNYGEEKEIFITSEQKIKNVNALFPVNETGQFVDYTSSEYKASNYIIVSHPLLWDEALQYKEYRKNSGYPNLYNPILVNIEELYDQFSYGIRKNPMAIRNFMKFAITFFDQVPEHLFIIGKSYRSAENSTSLPMYRKNATHYQNTLVPTICVPPSDMAFTSGLIDPNTYHPAVPTGRLSAKTPNHVSLYLNKVQQHEDALRTPKPWMKNVLHFAGGTGNLHNSIVSHLSQFENIIEAPSFGAHVQTFKKSTTEPIQINQSDSLKNLINNGVSLMTFFGHASGIGYDISIDNPEEYNNYGKYPLIFGLSCFAGDLFTTGLHYDRGSSSEEFVLIDNKGTIAYLANVGSAIDIYLAHFAESFYKNFGNNYYNKPLGKIIQQTIKDNEVKPWMKETNLDMTYHGDPAIIINSFEKPDYVITANDIKFEPQNISTEIENFEVKIALNNQAKAVEDSMIVKISRTYPNAEVFDTLIRVKAPYFSDTLKLSLPVDRILGLGNNSLKVSVDDFNEIDEINEDNNVVSVNFLISSSDIIPVFPYKYAIVPQSQISLMAYSGPFFETSQSYVFEIDTTDSFDSPFKTSEIKSSLGGIVSWDLPFHFTDSTVYFWRVAKESSHNWRESSFQYIPDKRGCEQAHFYQYKDNSFRYLNYNKPQRIFEFTQDIKSLSAQTGYFGYGMPWTEIWLKVNGSVLDIWSCLSNGGNGMKIAVINPISGDFWLNPDSIGNVGQAICKDYTTYVADFFTHTEAHRENLTNYLNSIPNDYYILAMSHRNHFATEYSEELYQAFESFGSTKIRTLQSTNPYIIFGQKGVAMGDPVIKEVVAANASQIIGLDTEYATTWDEGDMTSETFGPALKWGSLHWRYKSMEEPSTDEVFVRLVAVDTNGVEHTIINRLDTDSLDVYDLNERVPAEVFPYIKLKFHSSDIVNNTPSQLERWHLVYDPAPETAIDPSVNFSFSKPSLNQGDTLRLSISTRNIGGVDMDSLLVVYRIIKDNIPVKTIYKRLRNHPADDVLTDTVEFSTMNLSGANILQVEFNPDNDQVEMYHFNNIAEFYFNVNIDQINPIMDVTFDGQHIMNGDIVSAKPQIQVTLKDENPYLLLNEESDTANFRIQIKHPNNFEYVRIPFHDGAKEIMKFIPATSANKSHIIYDADFAEDGIYSMMVEGMDKSGNISGNKKYEIKFEVINKSTITQVMNWPNPFSTSTRFVFTLTGSQIPTYFKIQIMTISGKLVREIDLTELGNIKIGRNITEYAWDGRDQFGDLLANGVYLYRIVTNIGGEDIEKRHTSASKYFTKEFGKMVLIR